MLFSYWTLRHFHTCDQVDTIVEKGFDYLWVRENKVYISLLSPWSKKESQYMYSIRSMGKNYLNTPSRFHLFGTICNHSNGSEWFFSHLSRSLLLPSAQYHNAIDRSVRDDEKKKKEERRHRTDNNSEKIEHHDVKYDVCSFTVMLGEFEKLLSNLYESYPRSECMICVWPSRVWIWGEWRNFNMIPSFIHPHPHTASKRDT